MLAALARYAAFLLVALLGPGIALQRIGGVGVDPAIVLPLGLAFTALAYWISIATGQAWLFPVLVLAADSSLLGGSRLGGSDVFARPPLASGPSLRGALPPAVALVALLALTQYPWNRISSSGEF